MKPIISIVGRPNVGKSTLFNFLTGSRNALVVDQPGVTHDRQYGFGSYQDRHFILIDTGGLAPGDQNSSDITGLVHQQSLYAIEESDILIWLLNGRDGPTIEDEYLAKMLRPLCNKILLAVNKTEGLDVNIVLSDFYQFGFTGPYAISAKRGSGINQLMSIAIGKVPVTVSGDNQSQHSARVAIIGRPNVGKSTLINRIIGEKRMIISDQPGTTRDSITIPFEYEGSTYALIDTAGIRKRSKVLNTVEKFSVMKSLRAIDEAQIIILVLEAQQAITEQDATLLGLIVNSAKAVVIAVNKWDGLESSERASIKMQLDRKMGFIDYACIHFISALHGSGISSLLRSIKKISKSMTTEMTTSQVTSILQQAVVSHAPPVVRGRRIKLRYAHVGGHDPIRIIVHGNQTDQVPQSYRRYLANQMRKQLRLIGMPVLIDFKKSSNPYQGRKNILTKSPFNKRKRLINYAK